MIKQVIETARANVLETVAQHASQPVKLNEHIEWLIGYVYGVFAALKTDPEDPADRKMVEDFRDFATKHKHNITLPL